MFGNKMNLAPLLLILVFVMFNSSCSIDESGGIEENPSPVGESFPDIEEVVRQVRVQTLQRMMREEDPEDVLANGGAEASDILLSTRVVMDNGESYSVETTRTEWDITRGPGGDDSISAVDSSLAFMMKGNDVSWCGEDLSGREFVRNYMELHEESFEANEQYEESIADYVDCGTGELD